MKLCKFISLMLINIFGVWAHAQSFEAVESLYREATPGTSATLSRILKGKSKIDLTCKSFAKDSPPPSVGESKFPAQLEKDIQKHFGVKLLADTDNLPISIQNGLAQTMGETLSLDSNGHLIFVKIPVGRSFDSPYITRYIREIGNKLILAELEYSFWNNDPTHRSVQSYRVCELP